jgi:alpha-tubulin suppressor-like RCC1 family protein
MTLKLELPPTLIKSELTFRTIAAGAYHSLALDAKGKLYTWGLNIYGQLGLGDRKNRTLIAPALTFKTIAAGLYHSLALDTKGKLYTWGNNDEGQLGLGDGGLGKNGTIPTLTAPELTFRTIAAGYSHSLALDIKGKLYAWGYNNEGQLGLDDFGESTYRTIPTPVAPELTFRTIAAGFSHSLALDTKGRLYTWGRNNEGQLGMGDSGEGRNRTIPTLIKSELTFRAITGGGNHTLALDTKGKLYSWGNNNKGQLGLGGDGENKNVPQIVLI